MLRIENIHTRTVSVPLAKRVLSSIHDIETIGCVLVSIETNQNIVGESLLFTLNNQYLGLMEHMVQELSSNIIGQDAEAYEHIWQKLSAKIQFFGSGGFLVFGLSALDMAIWDVIGKYQRRPLHRMLGAARDKAPVYASGGLFLHLSVDELVEEAKSFVRDGYKAMKMRVGGASLHEDILRVKAVREAIGNDIALMADANQALNFEQAVFLGRKLQDFNLTWFEEPMPAHQFEAYSRLCTELDVPIATGESNYTKVEFRRLLETRGADIIMPDLSRIGGMTELRKVAAMAEAVDVPVSPHLYPEYCLGAMGGFANGAYVEQMPWFAPLFNETIEMVEGSYLMPDRAGFGFTFNHQKIEQYSINP